MGLSLFGAWQQAWYNTFSAGPESPALVCKADDRTGGLMRAGLRSAQHNEPPLFVPRDLFELLLRTLKAKSEPAVEE